MNVGDLGDPKLPYVASSVETRLDKAERAAEKGDAKETARQFETLFGVMLMRELRRSMPTGLFGDGPGADVYEGWFDEKLGEALAQDGALGIARMIEETMARAHQAQKDTEETR